MSFSSLKGDKNEALSFVKNILFDLAHSVGKSDAKNFISKVNENHIAS